MSNKVRVSTHDYDTKDIDVRLVGNTLHVDIGDDRNSVNLSSLIPVQKDFKVTSGSFDPVTKSLKLLVTNNSESDEVIIPLQGLLDLIPTIQGERGQNGTNGKSVYELAVQNGFIGSVTEWLRSLKGVKGDKGDKGDTGESAYNTWRKLGNEGTEQEFIDSLKGQDGIDGTDIVTVRGGKFNLTTLMGYTNDGKFRINEPFSITELHTDVNNAIDNHSITLIELYTAGLQILNTKETGLYDLFTQNGLNMDHYDTATIKLINPKIVKFTSVFGIMVEIYLYSRNHHQNFRPDGVIKVSRHYRESVAVLKDSRLLSRRASLSEDLWSDWSLETNVNVNSIPTAPANYTASKGVILNGNNIEANLGNNVYFNQEGKISTDGDALEIRASTRMIRPFNTIKDSEMQADNNFYKLNSRLKVGFEYNKPIVSYRDGIRTSSISEVHNVKIRLRPDHSNELAIRKIENAHPTHHEVTWVQEGNDWVFTVGTLHKNEPVFADLIISVDGTSLMKAHGADVGTTKNVNYLLDVTYDATGVTTVAYESGLRVILTKNS